MMNLIEVVVLNRQSFYIVVAHKLRKALEKLVWLIIITHVSMTRANFMFGESFVHLNASHKK